MPNQDSLTWPN